MPRVFLEGSQAVAEAVKLCKPQVISAYPITPQTHIVEELAKLKADGKLNAEYIYAESEFAAASIVQGASAAGARTYTATTSQGLLLMAEVLFAIAGMRLPIVLTCANRAVSAPLNIWNDYQDAMTVRDSGWLMLFAEDNQEAVDMHIMAYKIAEQISLPIMVNIDGFTLTHTAEPVILPEEKEVNKFLPPYNPKIKLDPKNPITMGAFADPSKYMEIREDLHNKVVRSQETVSKVFSEYAKFFKRGNKNLTEEVEIENADTIIVSIGSVLGTVRDSIPDLNSKGEKIGILKIKSFRPFPDKEIREKLKSKKYVAVLDKSISLGTEGVLATEVKRAMGNNCQAKIQSFIIGLGGRDITKDMIKNIVRLVKEDENKTIFINK